MIHGAHAPNHRPAQRRRRIARLRRAIAGAGGANAARRRGVRAQHPQPSRWQLGRDIVGGVYPPGSLLPNADGMCARFSVSRTALREAYSILSAKALIVARPKIGTRVRPKADWNLLDPEVLAWHLQATPTEHLRRRSLRPAADGGARGGGARGDGAFALDGRADRRGLRPDGPVQERRGRPDRRRSRLPHGDPRSDRAITFLTALGGLIHTSLECTFRLSWRGAARIQDDRLLQHRGIFEAIRDGSRAAPGRGWRSSFSNSISDVREYLRQRGEAAEPAPSRSKRTVSLV